MSGSGQHQSDLVIDSDVLKEIRDLMEEDFADLVLTFLVDSDALLGEIARGLGQGDAALVHRAAHKLKASAASLGAVGLSDHARELEALGRAGTLSSAETLLAAAQDQFGLVKEALEQTISGPT